MQYANKDIEDAMVLFEELDDDSDLLFDTASNIEQIITCIEKYPEELISALRVQVEILRDRMVEHDICPACGDRLEWVEDGRNWVPYGSTYVVESTYGHKKCGCGFSTDD